MPSDRELLTRARRYVEHMRHSGHHGAHASALLAAIDARLKEPDPAERVAVLEAALAVKATVCPGSGYPLPNPAASSAVASICGVCGQHVKPDAGGIAPTHAAISTAPTLAEHDERVRAEERERTLEEARAIALGCKDYSAGFSGAEREAYHHGMQTVANVIATRIATPDDMQARVVLGIGIRALKGGVE